MADALCHKTIKTATEGDVTANLTVYQAEGCRDAAARMLYGLAFLDIVARTNVNIGYRNDVKLFCGVLDIFGYYSNVNSGYRNDVKLFCGVSNHICFCLYL